jgi:hypothetical protein
LRQPHYIHIIADRFPIKLSSPAYPMTEDFLTALPDHITAPLLSPSEQTLFQEKVGNILYLAPQSRPDIMYSITQLSRRSNKCTARDMKAVDRLLNYIFVFTRDLGLILGSNSLD